MDHAFLCHISLACRISIATMPPKRAAAAGASDEVSSTQRVSVDITESFGKLEGPGRTWKDLEGFET